MLSDVGVAQLARLPNNAVVEELANRGMTLDPVGLAGIAPFVGSGA